MCGGKDGGPVELRAAAEYLSVMRTTVSSLDA